MDSSSRVSHGSAIAAVKMRIRAATGKALDDSIQGTVRAPSAEPRP